MIKKCAGARLRSVNKSDTKLIQREIEIGLPRTVNYGPWTVGVLTLNI